MLECERCGIFCYGDYWANVMLESGEPILCTDCKRTPQKQLRYFIGKHVYQCRPWFGQIDDEGYPVDVHGVRFTGKRSICGFRDCVVAEHRPDIIRHSVKINRLMAEKDYQPTEEQIQRALERAFKFLQEKE
jgi:hypothetical protein